MNKLGAQKLSSWLYCSMYETREESSIIRGQLGHPNRWTRRLLPVASLRSRYTWRCRYMLWIGLN